MAYPKVQYIDDAGHGQELIFALPPTQKPFAYVTAVRNDSFASSGVKQSVCERDEEFFDINLLWIAAGDDVEAWDQFMRWAIHGGEFEYYADSDLDTHVTCTLEETTWKAEWKMLRTYGFKITFRKAVLLD
jgi:hypothetical protein